MSLDNFACAAAAAAVFAAIALKGGNHFDCQGRRNRFARQTSSSSAGNMLTTLDSDDSFNYACTRYGRRCTQTIVRGLIGSGLGAIWH